MSLAADLYGEGEIQAMVTGILEERIDQITLKFKYLQRELEQKIEQNVSTMEGKIWAAIKQIQKEISEQHLQYIEDFTKLKEKKEEINPISKHAILRINDMEETLQKQRRINLEILQVSERMNRIFFQMST